MRMCQEHWDRLRSEIDTRGLSVLVPSDGANAAERFAKGVEGDDTIGTFDPLMYAHMAILSHATELIGIAALMDNEDGSERCPLCFLNDYHEHTCTGCDRPRVNGFTSPPDDWIVKAAEAAEGHLEHIKKGQQ
jgi:hypothetical protein